MVAGREERWRKDLHIERGVAKGREAGRTKSVNCLPGYNILCAICTSCGHFTYKVRFKKSIATPAARAALLVELP